MDPFPSLRPRPISTDRRVAAIMKIVHTDDWITAELLTQNYTIDDVTHGRSPAFMRRLRVAAREHYETLSQDARWVDLPTHRLQTLSWIARNIYGMHRQAVRLEDLSTARQAAGEPEAIIKLKHPAFDFLNWTEVHRAIEASRLTRLAGQLEAALKNVDQILRQAPEELWALGVRAMALRALGRHEDAFADFERFFNRLVETNLGYVLLANGTPLAFFPWTTIGRCDAIVRATEAAFSSEDNSSAPKVSVVAYQGEHMITVWEPALEEAVAPGGQ